LWNVYSFDQWGVELGKQLAKAVLSDLKQKTVSPDHDPSTAALLRYCHQHKG